MFQEGSKEKHGVLKRYFGEELDTTIFYFIITLTVPFVVLGAFWPELLASLCSTAVGVVFKVFQSTYLLGVTGILVFCLALAFSPFGKVTLGKQGEKAEFSTFSWFSMLFSAGMGIGLIFWSVAEPLIHMAAPPTGEANTFEAARLGLELYFFHWGFHAWAVYAIVALTMAYFQFRKGEGALFSSCLIPVIGRKHANGTVGRLVDTFAAWATIFGVVTGLGMGGMQMASGISSLMGIPGGANLTTALILIVTFAYIVTAVTGVSKGIKFVANLCVLFMIALMFFFALFGPTGYILKTLWMGLSDYMTDLPRLSFATTLFDNDTWTRNWTVFFWAFWIAWAPFVGAFIARISRGRTIREFILGVIILPPLFSFIFSAALGGTTMHLEFVQHLNVSEPINKDFAMALFVTLKHLPFFHFMTGLSLVLIFFFLITSCNSATYVAARFVTCGRDVADPKANNRLTITFGTILGLLTVVFNYSGGLKGLQTATILGSVPFFIVMCLGIVALIKDLIQNERTQKASMGASAQPE
ncbi:BCCT family transporter [Desulfoluna spongiiphila]|uniref:Glycine betaine transporter n=1 Tax=Desulfoluna spongiiphila TaxID=419481 RepID=A0A1G5FVJ4_9BACT|nr:BCCT family transporter [Desulfoluna spongiiphila]SCY43229.1 glycine betaine transporter [Desulfoluna spongiiphila]